VGLDLPRLSRTLHFLLRHGAGAAGLGPDAEGWYPVDDVARAVSVSIRRPVAGADVHAAAERYGGARFELAEGRIRAREAPAERIPGQTPPTRPQPGGPDLLYHAAPRGRLRAIAQRGALVHPHGGALHFSRLEAHAWRVAHRQWEDPVVLYVDAARARRDGAVFERTRSGQYSASSVPLRHVLNLRDGFAEQASAGGFLVDWSSGAPRIALIRVTRRGGATWEVAKGKLEPGEPPMTAAVREVCEEMGVRSPISVSGQLGTIRYGFSTPDGSPRLKTIHLYVLETPEAACGFAPAREEGIDAVRWFDLDDAIASLAHPSLRSAIGRLLAALETRAAELGIALSPPRRT
jgi:putative RNA 2'-phosphotransferase